jgi:competence protein ComFC
MPARPAYFAYQWLWSTLDLLIPPTCGGCGGGGVSWCEACQEKVEIISPPICEMCGGNIQTQGLCLDCYQRPHTTKAIRSWAFFNGPLRNAIHKLKYGRDISLGIVMARPIIDLFSTLSWEIDIISPVPLGVARMNERGYNQSVLLARPLAMSTGIKFRPQALIRVRETISQVGLTVKQRHENVHDAFRSSRREVEGKSVLVIDDVMTSGATLESCAAALFQSGVRCVYALTLARAKKSF